VLVIKSSTFVSICNLFHAKRTNSDEISTFSRSTPFSRLRSRETLSPRGTKFRHKKRDTLAQSTGKISWS